MPCRSLPVLMYHYVSHFAGPINVTPEVFEAHCKGMARAGWRGIGLDEAEAWLRNDRPLPKRCALITFDDGFLDNYIYAWPILEKYGHKGVIFAVTDRIGTETTPRAGMRDIAQGKGTIEDLPLVDSPISHHPLGYNYRDDMFINWAEARAMEQSGVMSVAGHTAHHLAVFADAVFPPRTGSEHSNTEEDAARRFHTPGRRGNTFYKIDGDVPWGLPRFTEQAAMAGPAFLPSDALIAAIRNLVPQSKSDAFAFFKRPGNIAALHDLVDGFDQEALGRMETEAETRTRIANDLSLCAATLKQELGHPVASLCWPWGKAGPLAKEEAEQCGFSYFYSTRPGANSPRRRQEIRRFKTRNKPWPWLRLRLHLYANPLAAEVYARIKA